MQETSLVTGCWIHGHEVSTHLKLAVEDPTDRTIITYVDMATGTELDQAVCSSEEAFEVWQTKGPGERYRLVKQWARSIRENGDELAYVLSLEVGKPIRAARSEVYGAAKFLDYCAEEGFRLRAEYSENGFLIVREPIGVCAIITPYNYPLSTLVTKAGAALVAGCTVVIKPDEHTPLSTLLMAKLASDAGIPYGVINVICGTGEKVGQLLISHPSVRLVSFTGSTKVGKEIYGVCAQNVKRIILELGGNCPAIIAPDARWDELLSSIIQQAFKNTGQYCYRITRLIVHKSIYESFIKRFVEGVRSLRIGHPRDEETQLGPLNNARIYEQFRRQIISVKEQGGRIVFGDIPSEVPSQGYYVQPIVFSEIPASPCVEKQEFFGPVALISSYTDDNEAISMANNTIFGLAAYVFTEDTKRALWWSHRLEAGSIWINRIHQARFDAPFGGFKQSGIGREKSRYGIESFTELKTMYLSLVH